MSPAHASDYSLFRSELPTMRRLNALLAAGYQIDLRTSQSVQDALWLDHPARTRNYRSTLILFPDGMVVSGASDDATRLRIYPADEDDFSRFVSSVPIPTWWERTADFRIQISVYVAYFAAIGLLWGVVMLIVKVARELLHLRW